MQDNQPLTQSTPNQTAATEPPATVQVDPDGKVTETYQKGKYKVEVIREKCISAASCVAIAPHTFKLDEENLAIIIDQYGEDDQTRLLAAQSCPTAAIIVTDTETGEQVWPK